MGLVSDGERNAILTDIQGVEDQLGDMDFKVAGTREGITALQMDIKIKGVTSELMSEALAQAREARMTILDKIEEVVPGPREEMKDHAPRMTVIKKMVERLIEEAVAGRIYTGKVVRTTDFGAFVEILPNTDGLVHISQLAPEHIDKVEDVARVGEEITVMVTAIDPMGKVRLSRTAVLEGWTLEEAMEHDRPPKRSSQRRSGPRRDDRSRR
jgi:polyribonucleotide nucleotidyltransferase